MLTRLTVTSRVLTPLAVANRVFTRLAVASRVLSPLVVASRVLTPLVEVGRVLTYLAVLTKGARPGTTAVANRVSSVLAVLPTTIPEIRHCAIAVLFRTKDENGL